MQFLYPDWPVASNVRAVVTTRVGGESHGKYTSLNLGAHVGDSPAAVVSNRARVREALKLPAEPCWLQQVHGIEVVDAAAITPGTAVADGAYTDRKNVVCAILTADCLPIFLCDRAGTEVALLHAGWRGLAAGIIDAGLRRLRASPHELLVWLGPAIGASAYEVGEDVRRAFIDSDAAATEEFSAGRVTGKWHMDIYRLAGRQLRNRGVREIYGGAHCTATQAPLFFSHRRDGTTGRMASLIWLT